MPYEVWRSWKAMRTYHIDPHTKQKIDKTARKPPMSFDQVKCAEGIFEALPQSMLQAFVVITDLYYGREVTMLQFVSLFFSYGATAGVLGLMGPPDIDMAWRAAFIFFCFVNVMLRSFSFGFFSISMWELDWFGDTDSEKLQWTVFVFVGSYLTTAFFVFKLQKKKFSLSTVILTFIAFICPVDISQFTILKTAQPRSPQLPFAIVRYSEIIFCCALFASFQANECVQIQLFPARA